MAWKRTAAVEYMVAKKITPKVLVKAVNLKIKTRLGLTLVLNL
jgi:hypothetical protein